MTEQAADPWGERLPRRLGVWSAMAVLVGTTIGSGIFRVPAVVAAHLHHPGPVLLAWVLGGGVTLLGALTIAELAAALPKSGGVFAYIYEGFGPFPAFLFGWSEMVVIRPAALGGIATIFAEYLGYFIPLTPAQLHYVAATAIVSISIINYLGVRRAAAIMNLITVVKFVALLGLGILAFSSGDGSRAHFFPISIHSAAVPAIAGALIPILWTYDGWSNLSFIGGEVKDPQRTLPLALIMGTLAIISIYLLINFAFIYLVPLDQMSRSHLIAASAAEHIALFAGYGGAVIAGLVITSSLGSLNGSMMTGPRVLFAMAERKLLFARVAGISSRFQTPSLAIGIATGLGVVYVLKNDFAQLADKFILGIWPFYILAVASVFALRRKHPELPRPYRTWGYPVVPAAFLAASVWVVGNAFWTDPVDTGVTFSIVLAGVPLYILWRAFENRRR